MISTATANERNAWQPDHPEAKLYRKGRGKEAKLSHMGHALTENRNGLILTVTVTEANGTAERAATLTMLDDWQATHGRAPATLGADKGYDDGELFQQLEKRKIEPHIPLVNQPGDPQAVTHKARLSGIRARRRMKRRMRTTAYRLSQRCRKKVEECFGWMKSAAGLRPSRTVGRWKLRQLWEVSAAAFNLVRLRRLAPEGA